MQQIQNLSSLPEQTNGSPLNVALSVVAVLLSLAGLLASLMLFIVVLFCSGNASSELKLLIGIALFVIVIIGIAFPAGTIVALAMKRPVIACLVGPVPIVLLVSFFVIASFFNK